MKGQQNVSDWIQPQSLKNFDIQTQLDVDKISVNVACQQNLATIIDNALKIQKPKRERFLSGYVPNLNIELCKDDFILGSDTSQGEVEDAQWWIRVKKHPHRLS